MPGFSGVLDVVDAIIYSAPVSYLVVPYDRLGRDAEGGGALGATARMPSASRLNDGLF